MWIGIKVIWEKVPCDLIEDKENIVILQETGRVAWAIKCSNKGLEPKDDPIKPKNCKGVSITSKNN